MLKITVDSDNLIRDLTKLDEEFQRLATFAVVRASRELVSSIVFKTLSPPPKGPPPKHYKRTWRLAHGWGPAAKQFEVYMPPLSPYALTSSDEGSSLFREDENKTTFYAENRVPYAFDVEYTGTWMTPWPKLRGGYNIVGSSVNEMSKEDKFPEYAREAWELAKNVA